MLNLRVQVPSRQRPSRRVADPSFREKSLGPERGDRPSVVRVKPYNRMSAKSQSVTLSEPCSVVTLLKAERQEEAEQVMASEGSRQRIKTWTGSVGLPGVRGTECGDSSAWNRRDPPWPSPKQGVGEGAGYKPSGEKSACQEGVRGDHTTCEGGDKPLEGRVPAWVGACVQEVSARECP